MTLCPARLEPTFSPRPWGSRSLAPYFPEMSNLAEPIGEAWMTGNECRFANGPFAGRQLGEVWPILTAGWKGTALSGAAQMPAIGSGLGGLSFSSDSPPVRLSGALALEASPDVFPLLVKFIFPQDKLSVQVHPDDAYAAAHEQAAGGRGKTEMWYAVDARPGAEVLVGLKSDVTREEFARAIADGTAEDSLERVPLCRGDAVFVQAGTAHTIGPGLVLCEVQQNSDLTYRVYDYNRRDAKGQARPLHIHKALEVMRFGQQIGGKIVPATIRRGRIRETHYAVCRYFATEQWAFAEPLEACTSTERFELLVILQGRGEILCRGERATYAPAQVWLIPAALEKFTLIPDAETSLLRTYVPGDLNRLKRNFLDRGGNETQWLSLVHL
jgi:mannose-6-phosphate isomerase